MFRHGGRERKRERGERERNINVINKHRSVASDMSPDWGSDVQPSGVQGVAPTHWATWSGQKLYFLRTFIFWDSTDPGTFISYVVNFCSLCFLCNEALTAIELRRLCVCPWIEWHLSCSVPKENLSDGGLVGSSRPKYHLSKKYEDGVKAQNL